MHVIRQDAEYFDLILGPFMDYRGTLSNDLTIRNTDIKIWKYETREWVVKDDGGADFLENGWYQARFTPRDYDTYGNMKIYILMEACMPVILDAIVLPKMYVDAMQDRSLISVSAAVVGDKTGYSLASSSIASIWINQTRTLTAATNITTDNQKIDNSKISNIDVAISTRLAASSYTAPDNTSIGIIKKAALNDWIVSANQLKIFDDDDITPIATWDLFDNNGNPTMTNVYKGVRV